MNTDNKLENMARIATAPPLHSPPLSPAELWRAGFWPSQLLAAGITPGQLLAAGITPAQLRDTGFNDAVFDDWDSIPLLIMPYTRLLADLDLGLRTHDQSTFGPTSDPGENLCLTPMCTAGAFVHMAGPVGYRLQKAYGWAAAYGHIHYKAHPGVPPQRCEAIPQEYAFAYIRQMAAKENEETN